MALRRESPEMSYSLERVLMEHIEIKTSLDSKLQTFSICFAKIRSIFEVIEFLERVFEKKHSAQPWFSPYCSDPNSWTSKSV